jgi:hypothetical protein
MRITTAGNVGIGTSSPGVRFVNAGASNSSGPTLGSGTVGSQALLSANGLYGMYSGVSNNGDVWHQVQRNDANTSVYNLLLQPNGGNVGIGTTSPGHKLQVSGAAGTSWSTLLQSNSKSAVYSAHADGYGMAIETSQNTSAIYTFKVAGGDGTNIGTNEYFRITGTGNVGIGTSSPSAKLNIYGDLHLGAYSNLSTVNIDNRTGKSIFTISTDGVNNAVGTTLTYSWADGGQGPLKFNNASGEVMRLNDLGNVGIGTTSPTLAKFVLNSGTSNQNALINGDKIGFTRTSDSAEVVYFKKDTSLGAEGTANINGYDGIQFRTQGAESVKAVITSGGSVGIGTTSPGKKLDVNGDALINNVTIGRGPGNISTNTAIGTGALDSTTTANYNIALGWAANVNNNANGLTAIGVDLNVGPDTNNLGQDCLAISQFNSNADSAQVPHIYAPKPISIGGGATNIITFDLLHYAGAIVEYMIRLDDGGDYAVGTVYMGWKSMGSGNMIDKRQIEWSNMSGFVFSLGGSGQTLVLTNTSGNNAWIRITVRGMMTN